MLRFSFFVFFLAGLFIPIRTVRAESAKLPSQVTLPVSYINQNPYETWKEPWANACEESSVAMVQAYYAGFVVDTDSAPENILSILKKKERSFGKSFDESISKLATVISNNFEWRGDYQGNVTLNDIRQELAAGRPVIIPFEARKVSEPYFIELGFDYHVAVIVGYDDETQEFLVHDSGLPEGRYHRYSYETLLTANTTYTIGDTKEVRGREALFTKPSPTCPLEPRQPYKVAGSSAVYYVTSHCTKRPFRSANVYATYFPSWDEVRTVSHTTLQSIPEDEVSFMPYGPRYTLLSGSLVKTIVDPRVYLILDGVRYPVLTGGVFTGLGYQWDWVEDVDALLLEQFPEGDPIVNTTEHPEHSMVKYADSPQVYFLDAYIDDVATVFKRLVPDETVFHTLGYRWDRIITIPKSEQYADGANMK